ncbi:S-methyl-5-thioribose kinase [Bacillus sp. RG28]|uniref:S-methyl-5-thioribose kinase n=1 Tax=Gottfriedia endophytica TaxID=2820819 RepID=A0A940SKF0_9BACI|nr:S-methyl-5-thioribose kinase [Gottfriedia endophytica]MBP0725959.1 S-methyl-5-thioribose kinase [Gottfriedia endophytica]
MSITQEKKYKSLTEETAISFLQQLGYLENEVCECVEIGDGNLNLVFQIKAVGKEKGYIVKQALPYAKVVGESWPLTIKRATIESQAIELYNKLIPEFVPKFYHHDEEQAITVIEDLSDLDILRKGLILGESYPLLPKHIGEFLATTLFYTSDFGASPARKKELEKLFNNPELCDITEGLVFTDPFFNSETNNFEDELKNVVQEIWDDEELQVEVAKLKLGFFTKKEALIHADLHTGSIFTSSSETKVIDPEFAFVGPVGFDLGQIQANLLFQVFTRLENKKEILDSLVEIEKVFNETFTNLWKEHTEYPLNKKAVLHTTLDNYWIDAIGVIGCELIRRSIGLAHVEDVESLPLARRLVVKKRILQFGVTCIKNRFKIRNIETLTRELEV